MKLLNRSGLSIRPCEPFTDWLSEFIQEVPPLESLRLEGMLYLIDEVESEDDFDRALDAHWQMIFENELQAWDEFGDHWPSNLTRQQFDTWFDVDLQLMSFDLSDQPLMRAPLSESNS